MKVAIDKLYHNYPDENIRCTTKIAEDKDNIEVSKHYKITLNGQKQFTVNLYHTTSKIMVNGHREIDFINVK